MPNYSPLAYLLKHARLHLRHGLRVIAKDPGQSHLLDLVQLRRGERLGLVLVRVEIAVALLGTPELIRQDAGERGAEQRLPFRQLHQPPDYQVHVGDVGVHLTEGVGVLEKNKTHCGRFRRKSASSGLTDWGMTSIKSSNLATLA
ncbi:hypothetical protein NQ317_015091 [Molorchus minor]|uniref:Uncharacterized protein n=1 Tax=Molorchus minor TaxID=1323400 RepID=A0ABQ9K6W9_9CUCU|nr:hypothetical protein NQ317_015091 [Molorchus minor]